jgi:hypothetical protein
VSEGGTCNCITGLASPDPATYLASANTYFAGDGFTTINQSLPDTDLFTIGGSGLLTIGTLGIATIAIPSDAEDDDNDVGDVDDESDSEYNEDTVDEEDKVHIDGAVTPTFTYTPPVEAAAVVEKAVAVVEAIAEKDDDTTTEDDLMVVSAELEKVLGGRNSGAAGDLVASARVSFAMGVDCPLQGFLFGSPVSDAESLLEQPRDSNGGRRTSLGELFMRTRFADEKVALVAVEEGEDGVASGENNDEKDGKEEGGGRGGGHKTVKKRRAKDENGGGGEGAPASAGVSKSKFQKVSQIQRDIGDSTPSNF